MEVRRCVEGFIWSMTICFCYIFRVYQCWNVHFWHQYKAPPHPSLLFLTGETDFPFSVIELIYFCSLWVKYQNNCCLNYHKNLFLSSPGSILINLNVYFYIRLVGLFSLNAKVKGIQNHFHPHFMLSFNLWKKMLRLVIKMVKMKHIYSERWHNIS